MSVKVWCSPCSGSGLQRLNGEPKWCPNCSGHGYTEVDVMGKLRGKIKKGTLNNREDGYNAGINAAMSMLSTYTKW